MFKKLYKKGASPLMMIMFAILVGVVILVVMNFRGASTTPRTLQVQGQNVPPSVGGGAISLVEDVTVTFSAKDASDDSINVNGNHQFRVCNLGGGCGSLQTVANLGTTTASPGDIIEVLFGYGNNSGSVIYLNNYKTFTLPDKGTFEAQAELFRNGSITIEVFNEEGNLIDEVLSNETIGAGDQPTLTHKIKGTTDRGQYAYGGCIIVEYNTSSFDNVVAKYGGVSTRISTPDWFTVSTTTHTTKTYDVPAFTGNTVIEGQIIPQADSTVNPGGGAGEDILLSIIPNEWRYNGDAKKFELFKCQENQDGNRIDTPIDSQFFRLSTT